MLYYPPLIDPGSLSPSPFKCQCTAAGGAVFQQGRGSVVWWWYFLVFLVFFSLRWGCHKCDWADGITPADNIFSVFFSSSQFFVVFFSIFSIFSLGWGCHRCDRTHRVTPADDLDEDKDDYVDEIFINWILSVFFSEK